MNDFIRSMDGFKNREVYYTDTDSIYVEHKVFELLGADGHINNELGGGKNDYNDCGIFNALFVGPKLKHLYLIDSNGVISKEISFKGIDISSLNNLVYGDFVKMMNDLDEYFVRKSDIDIIKKTVDINRWTRSFKDGVCVIEQKKVIDACKYMDKMNLDEYGEYELQHKL